MNTSVTLPASMRHVAFRQPGAAEVMIVTDGPLPSLRADEVLIRVQAAGVNRPDIMQREGRYPAPANASPLLGLEVAGTVVACGDAVTRYQPGDRVTALTNGGGYA